MEVGFLRFLSISLSCFVTELLIFDYIDKRYEKIYSSKIINIVIKIVTCFIMVIINLYRRPILNLVSWITIFVLIQKYFYIKKKLFILEILKIIIILSIFETLGIIFIKIFLNNYSDIILSGEVITCLEIVTSTIIMLFLYYNVFSKLWKKNMKELSDKRRIELNMIICLYSILNLIITSISLLNSNTIYMQVLLTINIGSTIIVNYVFYHIVNYIEENNLLKKQLEFSNQRTEMQLSFYNHQETEKKETIKILHDVHKHINMLESLLDANYVENSREYLSEVKKKLGPLIPTLYTDNAVLNLLLNEKIRVAEQLNIKFNLSLDDRNISFIDLTDIITLFGNLLDNAIEYCQEATTTKKKFINLKVKSHNDFTTIIISNLSKKNIWKDEWPISQKGHNHGIGLININNVVKKYSGNIQFSQLEDIFECSILLSLKNG